MPLGNPQKIGVGVHEKDNFVFTYLNFEATTSGIIVPAAANKRLVIFALSCRKQSGAGNITGRWSSWNGARSLFLLGKLTWGTGIFVELPFCNKGWFVTEIGEALYLNIISGGGTTEGWLLYAARD